MSDASSILSTGDVSSLGLHYPFVVEKQAEFLDLFNIVWIKKKLEKSRQKKKIHKTIKLIKRQGKRNKTLKFKYTNLKGETKQREVDPYEIKKGFMWATEHSDPRFIKRFFIKKIQNSRPGTKSFKPRWEVKLASAERDKLGASVKSLIISPKAIRIAEGLIGGTAGGLYGLSKGDIGDTREDLVEKALRGVAGGMTAALLGSYFYRNAYLPRKAIAKSQKRMWGRAYEVDAKTNVAKRLGLRSQESGIMRGWRADLNKAKTSKGFKELKKKYRLKEEEELFAPILAKLKAEQRANPQISASRLKAFEAGIKGRPRARGYSADVEIMYNAGRNVRAKTLSNEEIRRAIDATVGEKAVKHIEKLKYNIYKFSDRPYVERVKQTADKKIFGVGISGAKRALRELYKT